MWQIALLPLFIFAPVAVVCVAVRDPARRKKAVRRTLCGVALLGVVLLALFVPHLGTRASGAAVPGADVDGVTVISTARVGSYNTHVLAATDANALNDWLAANKLKRLDEADLEVVNDYIARKWVFVVANCLEKEADEVTAQPLLVTFSAAAPIYPMKLTGTIGTNTRVELFVVADRQASAEGFDSLAADKYQPISRPPWASEGGYYKGSSQKLTIGSPDAQELLWPGCVVTALRADLTPQQMARDVDISLAPLGSHRQRYFTARARGDLVAGMLAWGGVAILIVVCFAWDRSRRPGPWLGRALAVAYLAVLVAAGVTRFALPVVPATTSRVSRYHVMRKLSYLAEVIAEEVTEGRLSFPQIKDRPQILMEILDEGSHDRLATNVFDGQPIRYERSPGNYWVRRTKEGLWLCMYTRNGRELRKLLPAESE